VVVKYKVATLNEHSSVQAAILSDISDHSDMWMFFFVSSFCS